MSSAISAIEAVDAAATPNLRHLERFHDHVRLERKLLHGTLPPVRREHRAGS